MPHRAHPPTIRRAMGRVACVGLILGLLLAARRADESGVAAGGILVVTVGLFSVHLAIEGNRRDVAGPGRAAGPSGERVAVDPLFQGSRPN